VSIIGLVGIIGNRVTCPVTSTVPCSIYALYLAVYLVGTHKGICAVYLVGTHKGICAVYLEGTHKGICAVYLEGTHKGICAVYLA
jgi:hypothetical protein